ncbi:MAG: helicase [Circoviridae sp.]|nr:MAG: helicase [Circoviridae sp.]
MSRNRHWGLTIFDKIDGEDFILAAKKAKATSAVCQLEKCPDTGKLHLQCYIGFANARLFSAMQKNFKGAHLDSIKDPVCSWSYCQKEETRVDGPWMFGDPPAPRLNKKGDRAAFNRALLDKGAVQGYLDGDIRAEDYCRVSRAIDELRAKTRPAPESRSNLDNYWFYGKTGTGKSRACHERWPGHYRKDVNKWWDHYDGQQVVIIDDLDPTHQYLARSLKIWSDHNPFPAEVKFGKLSDIRPATIVVTSQYKPQEIFSAEDASAVLRRFKLEHFVSADLQGPRNGDNPHI